MLEKETADNAWVVPSHTLKIVGGENISSHIYNSFCLGNCIGTFVSLISALTKQDNSILSIIVALSHSSF